MIPNARLYAYPSVHLKHSVENVISSASSQDNCLKFVAKILQWLIICVRLSIRNSFATYGRTSPCYVIIYINIRSLECQTLPLWFIVLPIENACNVQGAFQCFVWRPLNLPPSLLILKMKITDSPVGGGINPVGSYPNLVGQI